MADVSQDADAARLVAACAEPRPVDILVSNVGIRRYQSFLDISPADWDTVLRTNLSAAFYLARHAIPHMRKRHWGRIVLISGFDGFWGQVTHRAHNITCKAGLHGLAKALAREFGADGVTVNTVAPGAIDTERDWSQYPHQEKQRIESEIPSRRFGDPREVAAAVAFLASPDAGFISGQATTQRRPLHDLTAGTSSRGRSSVAAVPRCEYAGRRGRRDRPLWQRADRRHARRRHQYRRQRGAGPRRHRDRRHCGLRYRRGSGCRARRKRRRHLHAAGRRA